MLGHYRNADIATQLKARFLLWLCIAGVAVMLYLLANAIIVRGLFHADRTQDPWIPAIIGFGLLLYPSCLGLLARGHLTIAAHGLLGGSFVVFWGILVFNTQMPVLRLDIVTILPVILSMIPLVIVRCKTAIFAYFSINIALLFLFVIASRDELQLDNLAAAGFLSDTALALVLLGLVIYQVFRINRISLERAMHDLEERRRAETALHEQEETFRALTENSPDTIMRFDLAGRLLYVNPAATRLTGLPPANFDSNTFAELEFPRELCLIWEEAKQKAVTERVVQRIELLLPNGKWVDWMLMPEFTAEGNVSGIVTAARDISDMKKIEQTAAESEAKIRAVIEQSHDGMIIANGQGDIVVFNAALEKMTGLDRAAVIGRPYWDVMWGCLHSSRRTPENLDSFQRQVRKALQTGKAPNAGRIMEGEIMTTAGQIRNFQQTGFIVRTDNELFLASILRDVTEIRLAETSMRESERKANAIFDLSYEMLSLLSPDAILLDVNRTALDVIAARPGDVIGRPFPLAPWWTHDANMRELVKNAVTTAASGQSIRFEATCRSFDEVVLTVDFSLRPVRDDSGEVVLLIAEAHDITELKRLLQEKQRLATVVESSPDIIIITDARENIQYVNRAFVDCYGYTAEEALGKNPSLFSGGAQGENYYRHLRTTIADGGTWSGKFHNRKKTGEEILVDAIVSPIRFGDNDQLMYFSIQRNITEQVKLENHLAQAQKMDALGMLAGGLAHDLNNVITGITGCADLLRLGLEEAGIADKDNLGQSVDLILESSDRAADMIHQLLTLARKSSLVLAPLDLSVAIGNVVRVCRSSFPKCIAIVEAGNAGHPFIQADPAQIEQVLLNLCINAMHAMTIMRAPEEKQGGTISVEYGTIAADRDFHATHPESVPGITYHRIRISDDGVGIAPEYLERIFDPFFTTKEREEGTGLGLAMAYNIVKQQAGFISVQSRKNTGTTFSIYLPEYAVDDFQAAPSREKNIAYSGTGTILIIDDERIVRTTAEGILTACGFSVINAPNGEKGLELFRENSARVRLVLLDMSMPDMSGLEAIRELRTVRKDVRILLASGLGSDTRINDAIKNGIDGFIEKPFSFNRLVRSVAGILGQSPEANGR